MKIVIDISEDVYTRLFDNGIQDNEIAVDDVCEMARAIRKGYPVKNHSKWMAPDILNHWIEAEVLDRIRAEFISLYPKNYAGEPELGGSSCEFSLNKVLNVIDKYKAESGG